MTAINGTPVPTVGADDLGGPRGTRSVYAFARALLPPSLREVASGHCLPQPLAAIRGRGTASAVEGVPASRMTEGALPQSSPRAALTAPSEREP